MMNWLFNRRYKLVIAFIVITAIVSGTLIITMVTLSRSHEINRQINEELVPSIRVLQRLEGKTLRANDLIKEWAYVQRVEEDIHRKEMRTLSDSLLPANLNQVLQTKSAFAIADQQRLDSLATFIELLISQYKTIENLLPNFDSYSDPLATMEADSYFLEGSGVVLTAQHTNELFQTLIRNQTNRMNAEIEEMNEQFTILNWVLVVVSLFVVSAAVAIAFFVTQLRRQKEASDSQNVQLDLLYRDLTDSINYAQRLQSTILPTIGNVRQIFPNAFILYNPKAVVSGDFYWFKNIGGKKLFAAADCTGHGVPGAFMSLVGHNFLNHVTKVFIDPAQILNSMNRLGTEVMKNNNSQVRDGMDVALCALDEKTLLLEYCGANIPLYLVREGELQEFLPTKRSIGSFGEPGGTFKTQKIQLQEGDVLFACSDGYADQFGGENNKKFMRRTFKELLKRIAVLEMEAQQETLQHEFDSWKGSNEQTDDILVIGIRI